MLPHPPVTVSPLEETVQVLERNGSVALVSCEGNVPRAPAVPRGRLSSCVCTALTLCEVLGPLMGREMQIPVTTDMTDRVTQIWGHCSPCKKEDAASSPRRPEVEQGGRVPLGAACVQRGLEEPRGDEDALQVLGTTLSSQSQLHMPPQHDPRSGAPALWCLEPLGALPGFPKSDSAPGDPPAELPARVMCLCVSQPQGRRTCLESHSSQGRVGYSRTPGCRCSPAH